MRQDRFDSPVCRQTPAATGHNLWVRRQASYGEEGGNSVSVRFFAVTLITVATLALCASVIAGDARATSPWTCGGCHGLDPTHPEHSVFAGGVDCTRCHVDGPSSVPTPAVCASCHHGLDTILASSTHVAVGCTTTPGCHGFVEPTPSPTPTPSESPTPTPTSTPTPSPTPTATPTPMPSPSATGEIEGAVAGDVGAAEDEPTDVAAFPATGYPPEEGGNAPWFAVTSLLAAAVTLLLVGWRLLVASRRHE